MLNHGHGREDAPGRVTSSTSFRVPLFPQKGSPYPPSNPATGGALPPIQVGVDVRVFSLADLSLIHPLSLGSSGRDSNRLFFSTHSCPFPPEALTDATELGEQMPVYAKP